MTLSEVVSVLIRPHDIITRLCLAFWSHKHDIQITHRRLSDALKRLRLSDASKCIVH